MSGTSLDGVDAVLLKIRGEDPSLIEWEMVGFRSEPYSEDRRAQIRGAIESGGAQALSLVHAELGRSFSRTFRSLLDACDTDAAAVVALGSHGQTVWHEPPTPGNAGVTLQLGDAAILSEDLGCDVIADFRSRDMAAGVKALPSCPGRTGFSCDDPGSGGRFRTSAGWRTSRFFPLMAIPRECWDSTLVLGWRSSIGQPNSLPTGPNRGIVTGGARRVELRFRNSSRT